MKTVYFDIEIDSKHILYAYLPSNKFNEINTLCLKTFVIPNQKAIKLLKTFIYNSIKNLCQYKPIINW